MSISNITPSHSPQLLALSSAITQKIYSPFDKSDGICLEKVLELTVPCCNLSASLLSKGFLLL